MSLDQIINEIPQHPFACLVFLFVAIIVVREEYTSKYFDIKANSTTNVCYAKKDDGKEVKIYDETAAGKRIRRRELLTTGGYYYREEETALKWIAIIIIMISFVIYLIKTVWF